MAAPIRLLYFAWVRDRLGRAGEERVLPSGVTTVRQLLAWLQASEPALAALADQGRSVRVSVNQAFAGPDDPVAAGDEIGLFPPVTGG